ncbi:diguanylate cyclase, partial [Escherichia coli]|nr:diguanylate cyclase [Escherichia coli]
DLLLVDVARRIGANLRSQDTIARLGGDEFVLTGRWRSTCHRCGSVTRA